VSRGRRQRPTCGSCAADAPRGRARSIRALAARATRRRISDERGQATIELVALIPLLLVAGLAGAAVVAGQSAGEQAGLAAQAGAMALIQGGDPRAAARDALPKGVRERSRVAVHGRKVTVRVRPSVPLPALAGHLDAEATADAGPEPPP
jgi:hypothetical protein